MTDDDYLRCTACGRETDNTASGLYDSMGRTRDGKRRRGTRWLKTLQAVVTGWLCDDCLTRAEEASDDQRP